MSGVSVWWQTFELSVRRLQQAGRRRDAVAVMIQHSRYLTSLADAAADTQSKHAHCLAVRASWRTLIRCCTVWLWGLDMLSPVHVISGISQRLLTVLGLWVLLYADRIHTHRCCLLWLDCTHPEILYLFYISAEGGRLSWSIDSAVRVFISPVHQESEGRWQKLSLGHF